MELRGKLSPRLSRNRSAQLARGCRRLFSSGPLGFQDERGAKSGRRRIDGSIRVRARRFRRHAARARNGKDAAAASHAADFDPPIYNVWKQQEKTPGSKHFGNSEVRWVDNLLYLYTQPFDIVVDPFAGGGSTIDLCKKRFRRCCASDRKPIIERETGIRKHDLTEGLPRSLSGRMLHSSISTRLIWVQAKGEYGDDPTDLANMELDAFNDALARLFKHIHTRRL
jgi:DNA methylase